MPGLSILLVSWITFGRILWDIFVAFMKEVPAASGLLNKEKLTYIASSGLQEAEIDRSIWPSQFQAVG